ncbi:hypothetical protein [Nocardia sp. MW-W600-9]
MRSRILSVAGAMVLAARHLSAPTANADAHGWVTGPASRQE